MTITEFCQMGTLAISAGTFFLMWRHALPAIHKIKAETIEQTVKIEKIEDRTNGLAQKVEAAAHIAGIVEGRKQVAVELGAYTEAIKESASKE